MRLRRLNDAGEKRLIEFLDSFGGLVPGSYSASVLTDTDTSERLPIDIEIEPSIAFSRKLELAEYLYQILAPLRLSSVQYLERDRGLWAWLAWLWFRQLCPQDKNGARQPGERARWIPAFDDARRYYRHFLFGPYAIYSANADEPLRAMCLLCQPLSVVGHMYYQLAPRQNLLTAPGVLDAATKLYYDPDVGGLRRASQSQDAEGSVFRFADVLMQFDRTFDLHSISAIRLLEMLPIEFARFRKR